MTFNSSSNDPRVASLHAEWTKRRARFFMTFAFVEGAILTLAIVAVYLLKIVDPDLGILVIAGLAVLGAVVMGFSILSQQRAYQRDLRDIIGH